MRRSVFAVQAALLLAVLLGMNPARPLEAGKHAWSETGMFDAEPVLTTGLRDAVTEVPFLDGFDSQAATPMTVLPRTSEGGFVLARPENFLFECQSYCLNAGTYAPGEGRGGNGYLYAPWRGPQAHIIRGILKKSCLHPEISQEDVQTLLWAVIARSGIRDLPREMKLTAAKLLAPAEILEVNSGALGWIAERLADKLLDRLPPIVRRIIEAEARLRELLTRAGASYDDLESVAVLKGDPPVEGGDRDIPSGRWSLHPDGYFIRYFPDGYTRLLIEINVPKDIKIEKDKDGRIIRMSDGQGCLLEAEYEDSLEPLAPVGRPGLRSCSFRALRFERPDRNNLGQMQKAARFDTGWTFVGLPGGEAEPPEVPGRFAGFGKRLARAVSHEQDLEKLVNGLQSLKGRTGMISLASSGVTDILNIAHFCQSLEEVLEEEEEEEEASLAQAALSLAYKAWMSSASRTLCDPRGEIVFDPADDPVPGHAASQRCGGSGRETENGRDCAAELSQDYDQAMEDFKNHLDTILHGRNVTCDTERLSSCVLDIFETDGNPAAYIDCFLEACHGLEAESVLQDIYAAMAILHVRLNEIRDDYSECMGK